MPPKETFHAKHGLRKKAFAIVTRFARHALFPGDALRPRGLFTRGGAGCREPAAERGPPCSPPFRARVTWERAGVIARGSHRLPRGRPSQVRPRSGPSPRVGDRGLRAVRRQERETERASDSRASVGFVETECAQSAAARPMCVAVRRPFSAYAHPVHVWTVGVVRAQQIFPIPTPQTGR